jgi:hypothetical protein
MNRFGAIAIDDAAKEGGVGTSEGLPSKARQEWLPWLNAGQPAAVQDAR